MQQSSHQELSFSIPPPTYRRRFLVFDVESTGLLPKTRRNSTNAAPITEYPYILQLSFAIYDLSQKKVIRQYDSYIDIPDEVVISEFITELTGATKELCKTKGRPIVEVLEQFYEAYMFCEGIVAHNMDFDEKMIMVELERNRPAIMEKAPYCFMTFNPMYEKVHGIERYCTMKRGTDICNILVESKMPGRPPSKKWPKLIELYGKLFDGATVDGLHNSMIDVLTCLRCYLKMRHGYDDNALFVVKTD
jgi:DNA polymerase III epsilon subunit-like protein